MMNTADIFTGFHEWILKSAIYEPGNPLFFTAGFFLFFFMLFFAVYISLGRSPQRRAMIILFFSLWFYYKCSGIFILVILAAGFLNFLIARAIGIMAGQRQRTILLLTGVAANLAMLVIFRYTPWFTRVTDLFTTTRFNISSLAFPVGLSFYTFANLSYLFDVNKGNLQPERSLGRYLTYITFFPIVQMGPIERASAFLPQLTGTLKLSREDVSEGFYLILSGALKKMVISDYVNLHMVSQVFSTPERYTGMENLVAMIGYSLVIYCDFSGYTDMARGIARWMGFHIQVNFNLPYKAENIGEFWRRWHISLSNWLRDYLFLPIAFRLSRLMKMDYLISGRWLRTDLVIFGISAVFTFTVCGIWHGIGWNFLLWGLCHGFALAIQRSWSYTMRSTLKKAGTVFRKVNRIVGIILTFSFVSCAWVLFRMHTPEEAVAVFNQIVANFYIRGFPVFVTAYFPVLMMIVAGYLLHFTPDRFYVKLRASLAPMGWIWKSLIAMVVVAVIFYFKSLGSAMPIYIQF
jgi:D-alanyl-lipoteichoic acid acyltransferase DltB (MBOAT superfamily)